jgi:hypothetical protein
MRVLNGSQKTQWRSENLEAKIERKEKVRN